MKVASGEWRWMHTYGTIFERDTEGKVQSILNITEDITEEKRKSEKIEQTDKELRELNSSLEKIIEDRTNRLKQSESLLKEAQQLAKVGSWEYDLETQNIQWSEEQYRIFGFNPKNKMPTVKEIGKLFPELNLLTTELSIALEKKRNFQLDLALHLPSGETRYVQMIGRPVFNSRGKPIKVLGTSIDITERKQHEVNLEFLSSASKLLSTTLDYRQTLINIAHIAVPSFADWCTVEMLKGEDTELVAVAHKDPKKVKWALEFRKSAPSKIDKNSGVGKVIYTGKSEFYPVITEEMLQAAVARNPKAKQIIREIGFSSVIIVPIRTEGKVVGALSLISTESHRHFSKSDLAIAEEVANRVSLTLDNAKLYTQAIDAKKQAEKASKLRDEFISIASHELKTPITSLKMYGQLLERRFQKLDDKESIEFIRRMNEQVNKQTKLIADLLDISRIELGKLDFHMEKFDLNKLIEEVAQTIQVTSQTHKIKIQGHVDKKIYADPDRIAQALINLINNAIKYSPDANQVLIKLLQDDAKVTICVKDFGIGIPKSEVDKIFDRFYQAHEGSAHTFPGLGIGLFVTNEIIKRHSGSMKVNSKEGKGSTFSFTLPKTTKKPS